MTSRAENRAAGNGVHMRLTVFHISVSTFLMSHCIQRTKCPYIPHAQRNTHLSDTVSRLPESALGRLHGLHSWQSSLPLLLTTPCFPHPVLFLVFSANLEHLPSHPLTHLQTLPNPQYQVQSLCLPKTLPAHTPRIHVPLDPQPFLACSLLLATLSARTQMP